VGEALPRPGLARCLRLLGARGKAGFYDGPVSGERKRRTAALRAHKHLP